MVGGWVFRWGGKGKIRERRGKKRAETGEEKNPNDEERRKGGQTTRGRYLFSGTARKHRRVRSPSWIEERQDTQKGGYGVAAAAKGTLKKKLIFRQTKQGSNLWYQTRGVMGERGKVIETQSAGQTRQYSGSNDVAVGWSWRAGHYHLKKKVVG